jgi:hypothetical protein
MTSGQIRDPELDEGLTITQVAARMGLSTTPCGTTKGQV